MEYSTQDIRIIKEAVRKQARQEAKTKFNSLTKCKDERIKMLEKDIESLNVARRSDNHKRWDLESKKNTYMVISSICALVASASTTALLIKVFT